MFQCICIDGLNPSVPQKPRLECDQGTTPARVDLLGLVGPPSDPSDGGLSVIKTRGFVFAQAFSIDAGPRCLVGFGYRTHPANGTPKPMHKLILDRRKWDYHKPEAHLPRLDPAK